MRPCCLRSGKAGMKTLIAVAPRELWRGPQGLPLGRRPGSSEGWREGRV